MVQKSLTYYQDSDDQLNPKMLHKFFNGETCKQKIIEEVLKLE